jgi:hypothetical protein
LLDGFLERDGFAEAAADAGEGAEDAGGIAVRAEPVAAADLREACVCGEREVGAMCGKRGVDLIEKSGQRR